MKITRTGYRLKVARTIRGWSQTDLANAVGVYPSVVSTHEKGGIPKVITVHSYAKALGIDPGWLAFGIGEGPKV